MKTKRKRASDRAVRFNVTMPPSLAQEMEKIRRQYGFAGPSDYLQARVRKDAGLELKPT